MVSQGGSAIFQFFGGPLGGRQNLLAEGLTDLVNFEKIAVSQGFVQSAAARA